MDKEQVISYPSHFDNRLTVNIVFKEYPKYDDLKSLFAMLGFGFIAPDMKLVIIDGETVKQKGFKKSDLLFIEAHEISHYLLGHGIDRNPKEEMEADLGAYLLLKKHGFSTKRLETTFEERHGRKFSILLLNVVKKRLEKLF